MNSDPTVPPAASASAPETRAGRPVERLFPFAVRARKLIFGRETLERSKRKLQWVLIATDISEGSRNDIVQEFGDYPVVQQFTAADFERFFNVRNAKVVGFVKSTLAKSIYAELKECRINKPAPAQPKPEESGANSSGAVTG